MTDPTQPTGGASMSDDRTERVAEVLRQHDWRPADDDFGRSCRHADHQFHAFCAICSGDVGAIAAVAVAALDDDARAKVARGEALLYEWLSRTQEGRGRVSDHWRGRDFADGYDLGLEEAVADLAAALT